MRVPPVENPACAAFKEYEQVPEMVPLDFTEDGMTWVASNLSGAAVALWEMGIHAGLVGDAQSEGDAWEGRASSGGG